MNTRRKNGWTTKPNLKLSWNFASIFRKDLIHRCRRIVRLWILLKSHEINQMLKICQVGYDKKIEPVRILITDPNGMKIKKWKLKNWDGKVTEPQLNSFFNELNLKVFSFSFSRARRAKKSKFCLKFVRKICPCSSGQTSRLWGL